MGLWDRLLGRTTDPRTTAGEALCTVLLPDGDRKWSQQRAGLVTSLVGSRFECERLDVRFADGIGHGAAHLRVCLPQAPQTIDSRTRAISSATELASALVAEGALGVVIHQAGEVLFSGAQWARRTQRLGEPDWTPALAWTDLGHADGVVLSYGLKAFGLPEVGVVDSHLGALGEDEAWHRAQEVCLAASCTMVARGSGLRDGERLHVIAGTEYSGAPASSDNLGLDEPAAQADTFADWRCERVDDLVRLVPPPLLPLAQRFALLQPVGMMPYPSYRWLVIDRLGARGYRKVAQLWPQQVPGAPAHELLIFEHQKTGRYLTTTCGLGRVAQRDGTDEHENQYVEFAVELTTHAPRIATALGVLSWMLHVKDPDSAPIGPGHRSATANIPFPWPWVVYDRLPDLDLGASPVRLFQPLFMSAAERAEVPVGAIGEWVEANREHALARWTNPVMGN